MRMVSRCVSVRSTSVHKETHPKAFQVVMPLGSSLIVLSLLLLSFCQQDQVYQVFLAHGVLFGLGSACVYVHPSFLPSFLLHNSHVSPLV